MSTNSMPPWSVCIALATICKVAAFGSTPTPPPQTCVSKCKPGDECFPDDAEWKQLERELSGGSSALFKVPTNDPKLSDRYMHLCDYDAYYDLAMKTYPYVGVSAPKDWAKFGAELADFADSLPWNQDSTGRRLNSSLGISDQDLKYYSYLQSTFGWARSYGFHGLCMQNKNLQYVDFNESNGLNLPAYTVAVQNDKDVQAVLRFANANQLQVVIKNTGHNWAGSNTANGSLLIWTALLRSPEKPTIDTDFRNTCGKHISELANGFGRVGDVPQAVIKYAAGAPWTEVVQAAAKAGYYVVSGANPTVGAGGGWLMGSGLSLSHRHLGYGVDNVVSFDAVLADGTIVTADECTNTDLFWALRGGGGGSFAVVTRVTYKLWKDSPIQQLSVGKVVSALSGVGDGLCNIPERFVPVANVLDMPAAVDEPGFSIDSLQSFWQERAGFAANHDFSECPGGLPAAEKAAWQFNETQLAQSPQALCVAVKTMHLCGAWAELMLLDFYMDGDPRWGSHTGSAYFYFRGTQAEANATFLKKLTKFWDFPGAAELGEAFWASSSPYEEAIWAPSSPYEVRGYDGLADFAKRGTPGIAFSSAMDTYAFGQSGLCPNAASTGECVKEWIERETNTAYVGPTDFESFQDGNSMTNLPLTIDGLRSYLAATIRMDTRELPEESVPGGCQAVVGLTSIEEARSDPVLFAFFGAIVSSPALGAAGGVMYYFGGNPSKVAPEEAAIGPSHRTGLWYYVSPGPSIAECKRAVRQPDSTWVPGLLQASGMVSSGATSSSMKLLGAAFNHMRGNHHMQQGDFEGFTWGSNVPRLKKIKDELDPTRMFNVKNTFGYRPAC